MIIINNFLNKDDVKLVYNYVKDINFHTKDNHVPLHENLFKTDSISFDIHTRGEMPSNILEIFSKYSKLYYEIVSDLEDIEYNPPMFSKHYLARYRPGARQPMHFDNYKGERGAYGSYIYWNNDFSGGELHFVGKDPFIPNPGDLILFKETEENSREILPITSGNMYLSESWSGPKGISLFDSVVYDAVDWDDWEIRGF